jgi:epoxyqueuosine reductase
MSSQGGSQITLPEPEALLAKIRLWADELGFQQLGVSDVDLGEH